LEYFFIFDSFVWPQTVKIPIECQQSINNLLKIFFSWSENPFYYPLLQIKANDFQQIDQNLMLKSTNAKHFENKNILDIIFELINSPKCSQPVIEHIMNMLHNLVTFADFNPNNNSMLIDETTNDQLNDSETLQPLPFDLSIIHNELKNGPISIKSDELNFGTTILKPYVDSIVNHIEKIVIEGMTKKNLPPKPLKILSRISGFASNSHQQCQRIILLLIPYLIKNRKQSEDDEINILNSIKYLIKQVSNVGDFIYPLSRLFAVLKNRLSRVALCDIFDTIKELNGDDDKYTNLSQLVVNLNAWDAKRIEEPDYILRLDAFKKMNSTIQEWSSFDMNLASCLVYNCIFFLNNVEDLAIKESATNCLKLFLEKTSSLKDCLQKLDKSFLESNFVSEIKNGLRNKSESARHEFVHVLVTFIQFFQDIFPKFKDLSALMDADDPERDFFLNITHIQIHRRARALKKLQRACNDHLVSTENLLSFMMPLVRSFLDNEIYYKYDYLIDDACIAIGSICYVLSWPKYIRIVEYYLKILPKNIMNQKLVIKVLVNVLDAFHYDLSASTVSDYYTNKRAVVEEQKDQLDEENEDENDDGNDGYADDADDNENDDETKVMDARDITNKEIVKVIEVKTSNSSELTKQRTKQLVSISMANKIHSTITKIILPSLFKCLTKRLKSEDEHKMNKRTDENGQILRVPMALAILKLLKNLPSKTLEANLPGLLLKVCEMLKSRAISVRTSTRECLMKMINTLPDKRYYFYVFKELTNALTRGYQVHVLTYTIQMILKNIENQLQVGDLDSSVSLIMKSVYLELFTNVSEEKEVKQILAKLSEAKQTSSFNTLELLGKYTSSTHILELIRLFKQQLDECNSRKLLRKIEESLRRVTLGMLTNTGLDTETLMLFSYGLINETFSVLMDPSSQPRRSKFKKFKKNGEGTNNDDDDDDNDDDMDKKRIDYSKINQTSCLLIQAEPKRGNEKPKVVAKTNQHVIVEFALQILNQLIKQNRLSNISNETVSGMLEPYLPKFVEYLDGKYLKVTTMTLRCLNGFLRYPMPALSKYSKEISNKLFTLLRTYSNSSSDVGTAAYSENFELLMICFKLISTLIRDCDTFQINDEQLQVLVLYAERNLYDNNKQASAFNLLKSILSRKLHCDELNEVLAKVMKLSIQADSLNVRMQSRQTILTYMLEYSLGDKKIQKLLEFYIVQLDYEYENGRESALEMLATVFTTFPTVIILLFYEIFIF
jgi:U3 small nucleolar RNA-associated protein 20